MNEVITGYLSAGGDAGTLGLFLYLMRGQLSHGRRLLRLELGQGISDHVKG